MSLSRGSQLTSSMHLFGLSHNSCGFPNTTPLPFFYSCPCRTSVLWCSHWQIPCALTGCLWIPSSILCAHTVPMESHLTCPQCLRPRILKPLVSFPWLFQTPPPNCVAAEVIFGHIWGQVLIKVLKNAPLTEWLGPVKQVPLACFKDEKASSSPR